MNTRQRSGLQYRQWLLAGVITCTFPLLMALPANALDRKDCGRPEPDAATVDFCTSIGIPQTCFLPNLSQDDQRSCDQQRFNGEPHFNVVRLSADGAVRSIQLLRTDTGRTVFTAHPHGTTFAVPADGDAVARLHVEFLEQLLTARPTPGSLTASSSNYATGLPIGWNNSVSVAPGQCLNYTISNPGAIFEQASFSSQNTASSTAEQIKVSASVSGAYEGFKASDTFSYSDNYQSSTNSSNQYFNFYSLRSLNTTVDKANPLTTQGHNAGASFSTLCGTQYLEAAPVGMVATLSINYGSSSSTTQTNVSNKFKASFGLDSVSTAVSTATKDTSSSSYFTFVMSLYGGGVQAATDLNNAFATIDPTTHEAYYAECAAGNGSACNTFTSNLGAGATSALNSFNTQVAALSTQTNPDLSIFQIFPDGVASATTLPARVTTAIPLSTSDALAPYKTQLEQYASLLNQIATLNNRVVTLNEAVQAGFNPTLVFDLEDYLNRLEDIYMADRATLLTNLETCLAATSQNVKTVCAPIITNTALNAFEYYAAGQPHANFFAQQNTLALQYVGKVAGDFFDDTPADVMYLDALPPTPEASASHIVGEAAFVSFVDRGAGPIPYAPFLVLEPNQPLSTNNVSTKVRINPPAASPFFFFTASIGNPSLFTDIGLLTTVCTPTFDIPCAIDYEEDRTTSPWVFTNEQIEGLFGGTLAVTSFQGKAEKVGSGSPNAKLQVKGKINSVGPIDLSAATLELTRLLQETHADEELLSGTAGDITPLVLTPRKGSKATAAMFETPSGQTPKVQAEIKMRDPRQGVLEFSIKVERALIDAAQLEESSGGATALQVHFVLADGVNRSVVMHREQDWLCQRDQLTTR